MAAAARADSAHFRIRRIADDGTRLFDVAQCYLPVPFPDREASDTVQAQAAMLRPAAPALPASRVEAIVGDALELPRVRPPVTDVVVSSTDEVWLRREAGADGSAPWEIRDPSGRVAGFLRLPADVQLLAVDGDRVWTAAPDSLDVPMISLGRRVPPEAR